MTFKALRRLSAYAGLLFLYLISSSARAQIYFPPVFYGIPSSSQLPASCAGAIGWVIASPGTGSGSVYTCQAGAPALVSGGGGGSGTVTSVTFAGTANQITATGTCTGTTVINCTLSIPTAFQLPVSTGISGLGSNVNTFLATPSGSNFNAMIAAGGIPVNCNGTCAKSAAYTTVLGDGGGLIIHAIGDNNARTFTIDSNANVAFPLYTVLTFINSINTVTIAITSDTLTLAGTASTGSRTLAANGVATAVKVGTTSWIISGPGLT